MDVWRQLSAVNIIGIINFAEAVPPSTSKSLRIRQFLSSFHLIRMVK
jgi:hypothetical protein